MNSGLRMYMLSQGDQHEGHPMHVPGREMGYRENGGGYEHPDRYMPMHDYPETESRYRGKDGRWKAGRRRGEYDGEISDAYHYGERMDDDKDGEEMDENVIQFPPEGRQIGFGSRDREYETRNHYDGENNPQRKSAVVGGTMWMEPTENEETMDYATAEKWVRSMRGEDAARPTGGRWSMEDLKPMAQKFGIKPDTSEFIEFYVMTNHMYSKYCAVAKKFNITSPEYYGMMALAWMRDKDAVPNKTEMYYRYCVRQ